MNGVNWIDIVLKVGLQATIILFIGWFLVKELWPWAKKQFEELVTRQKGDLDRFMTSLSSRDKQNADESRETVRALSALTSEIRGLRDDVQEIKKSPTTPTKKAPRARKR